MVFFLFCRFLEQNHIKSVAKAKRSKTKLAPCNRKDSISGYVLAVRNIEVLRPAMNLISVNIKSKLVPKTAARVFTRAALLF